MHEIIIRHDDDATKDYNAVYLLSIPHSVEPLHPPEKLLDFLQLFSFLLWYKKGKVEKVGRFWSWRKKSCWIKLRTIFWMYKLSYNHNT